MAARGITHLEAYEAWNNWSDFYHELGVWNGYGDERTGYGAFEKVVGGNIFHSDLEASDETIRKVKLLSSPHWRTVMKAIEANATQDV